MNTTNNILFIGLGVMGNPMAANIVASGGYRVCVHDIDPATWREHQPLVHGFIDYPRLLSKLREIRYPGVLIFELMGEGEKMPEYLRESKQKLDGYLAALA